MEKITVRAFKCDCVADMRRAEKIFLREDSTPADHGAFGAILYNSGKRVFRKKAIPYLEEGSEAEIPMCIARLGDAYFTGEVVRRDVKRGIELYERAGRLGDPDGAFSAGNEYFIGRNVEPDYEKAFELFTISSEGKDPRGLNGLGMMYMCGLHVERDLEKARELLSLAASKGSRSALGNLRSIETFGEDFDYKSAFLQQMQARR